MIKFALATTAVAYFVYPFVMEAVALFTMTANTLQGVIS